MKKLEFQIVYENEKWLLFDLQLWLVSMFTLSIHLNVKQCCNFRTF